MHNRSLGLWALAALVLAVLLWIAGWATVGGTAGTFPPGMGPGMMPWFGGPGFGWPAMLVMMLSMLLFWAAVILGLVLLIRWLITSLSSGRPTDTDALEIARRRYASGEISREEYERLRDDLVHKL